MAGSPRFIRGVRNAESQRRKQRNHFLFLLLHAQFRNGLRKILDGKESALSVHGRDSDGGEPRIQNIFAVAWRIHPAGVNRSRSRTDGNIFGDDTETRAGFRETSFEIGFTGELMLEHIQVGHAKGVETSGLEKSGVPLKSGESLRGAFAIEGFEELALRVVLLKLRAGRRRKEKKNCGGEKKF